MGGNDLLVYVPVAFTIFAALGVIVVEIVARLNENERIHKHLVKKDELSKESLGEEDPSMLINFLDGKLSNFTVRDYMKIPGVKDQVDRCVDGIDRQLK